MATFAEILNDPEFAQLPGEEQTKVRLHLYRKAQSMPELRALPEPEQRKVRAFILGDIPEMSQEREPGRPAGFEVFPPGLGEAVSPGEGEGLLGLVDPGVWLAPENLLPIGALKRTLEQGGEGASDRRAPGAALHRGGDPPPGTCAFPHAPGRGIVPTEHPGDATAG